MIKVIYFDLGKVIVNFDYQVALQQLLQVTPLPADEVLQVLTDETLIFGYETGRISTPDFYRTVSRRLKLEVSVEAFKQLWGSMFLPETLISETFLEDLKRKYRLILLSNTNEIHFEFVREKYAILRHIEEHLLSYLVGSMKPDRRIFELAIEKAGVPAHEIFFTDDRSENIAAAKLAGVEAVQFQSEDQLKLEMNRLGIVS